jgi:cell shape-determining protein MreD
MGTVVHAPRRRTTRVMAVFVALLILIMVVAVARRMAIDVPNVLAGTLPPDTYDVRFVEHHWLAYLHIGPGILYLLGAPLQLTHRFRSRHYTFHRRLGRVLAASALMSGVFALVFASCIPSAGSLRPPLQSSLASGS